MPCNSDHMKQTGTEAYNQRTAKLYLYVSDWVGSTTADIRKHADDYYCQRDYTKELCAALRALKKIDRSKFERVVYNARSKTSRDLADWWEEHKLADRKRLSDEAAERSRKRLIKSALDKLTPAERKALRER